MTNMVVPAEEPGRCSPEHPGQGGQQEGVCPGEHRDRLLYLQQDEACSDFGQLHGAGGGYLTPMATAARRYVALT